MESRLSTIEEKSLQGSLNGINTDDDQLILDNCERKLLYEHIVGAFTLDLGKAVSKRERTNKGLLKNINLVYGEITFDALESILNKIKYSKFHFCLYALLLL